LNPVGAGWALGNVAIGEREREETEIRVWKREDVSTEGGDRFSGFRKWDREGNEEVYRGKAKKGFGGY